MVIVMSSNTEETPRVGTPTATEVRATWRGDCRYEIGKANGASSTIDAAAVAGLGPVDTMLGALAACSSMDVVQYLEKRRTPVEGLTVVVHALRRAEAPRRVLSVALTFEITGTDVEEAHAERAIALGFGRYCSVASSLAPDIAVELRLALNGHPSRPIAFDATELAR